jgi:hypothetical protein
MTYVFLAKDSPLQNDVLKLLTELKAKGDEESVTIEFVQEEEDQEKNMELLPTNIYREGDDLMEERVQEKSMELCPSNLDQIFLMEDILDSIIEPLPIVDDTGRVVLDEASNHDNDENNTESQRLEVFLHDDVLNRLTELTAQCEEKSVTMEVAQEEEEDQEKNVDLLSTNVYRNGADLMEERVQEKNMELCPSNSHQVDLIEEILDTFMEPVSIVDDESQRLEVFL